MPIAKQQIDVRTNVRRASREWDRFVKWVLVGNYRFVCDEFSCQRAAEAGVVTFARNKDRSTRVCITFAYEDESPNTRNKEQMVNARLLQDLARFKRFAETGSERMATADLDTQAQATKATVGGGPGHAHQHAVAQTDETGKSGFVA